MSPTPSQKRQRQPGYNRKHDRQKFRRTTNPTVHKKSLPSNLSGILFSCTPRHEDRAFRDAVLLLSKHHQHLYPTHESSTADKPAPHDDGSDVNAALEQELATIRSATAQRLFTRVDGGVQGCVFVVVNHATADRERLVELALREARETGFAPSRHCVRMLPIHVTCYAKAAEAAEAAVGVVERYFPRLGEGDGETCTYAIVFRARLNQGAHRDEYIEAIAAAVEKKEPRYKVDLTKPQVVLLVEVVKTTCCLGAFRYFYELAKMNLREAACPTKAREGDGKAKEGDGKAKEDGGKGKAEEGRVDGAEATERDGGTMKEGEERDRTREKKGEPGKDSQGGGLSNAEDAVAAAKEDVKGSDRGDSKGDFASDKSAAGNAAEEVASGDSPEGKLEAISKETQTAESVAAEDADQGVERKELTDGGNKSEEPQEKRKCEQPVVAEDDRGGEAGEGDVDKVNTE